MRITTVFKRLLQLNDVNVTSVIWGTGVVTIVVALKRRRLWCPHCRFKTSAHYDRRPRPSRWRHLDLGVWRVEVRANLRRLQCPSHGVVVEAVPFARPGAHLTRDFDDLLARSATRMDKSAVAKLTRVSWRTVGRACARVVATELDPARLHGLFRIGVDEIIVEEAAQVLDPRCRPQSGEGRLARTGKGCGDKVELIASKLVSFLPSDKTR